MPPLTDDWCEVEGLEEGDELFKVRLELCRGCEEDLPFYWWMLLEEGLNNILSNGEVFHADGNIRDIHRLEGSEDGF